MLPTQQAEEWASDGKLRAGNGFKVASERHDADVQELGCPWVDTSIPKDLTEKPDLKSDGFWKLSLLFSYVCGQRVSAALEGVFSVKMELQKSSVGE